MFIYLKSILTLSSPLPTFTPSGAFASGIPGKYYGLFLTCHACCSFAPSRLQYDQMGGNNPSSLGIGFPNFSMKNGDCIFKEQTGLRGFGLLKIRTLLSLETSVTYYPVT
jgi:hypothetical protein